MDKVTGIVSGQIRVLVIHDVRIILEGLTRLLSAWPELTTVQMDEQSVAHECPSTDGSVDVVLLDAGLDPSILADRIQQTNSRFPAAKVIVIGVTENAADILAGIEAGASAYTLLDSSSGHLVDTIREVYQGEVKCPPQISALLFERVASLKRQLAPVPDNKMSQLTPREREILQRVSEGMSNKEISSELGLELQTVKNYVHHILEKLRVNNRRAAATYAQKAALSSAELR